MTQAVAKVASLRNPVDRPIPDAQAAAGPTPRIRITSLGAHAGDPTTPSVLQGMGYPATFTTSVPDDLLNPEGNPDVIQGYRVVSYTWTFPQGAVKGFGTFSTGNPVNDPDGDYTTFVSGPTDAAAKVVKAETTFTTDDLDHIYAQDNDADNTRDHTINQFYFGPESTGIVTVSITMVWNKIVNDEVDGQVTATDTVSLNVFRPDGSITINSFGTAGVSPGLNYLSTSQRLGIDVDTRIVPDPANPGGRISEGPQGISWTAMVTADSVFRNGSFGVVQTVVSTGSRSAGTGPYTTQNWTLPNGTSGPTTLDTQFPYHGTVASFPPSGQPVIDDFDSPGVELKDWTSGGTLNNYVAEDKFVDTLMYKPGGNSIWVPVGSLTWGWRGLALFSVDTGLWRTGPTTSQTPPSTFKKPATNADFPNWTNNATELNWR